MFTGIAVIPGLIGILVGLYGLYMLFDEYNNNNIPPIILGVVMIGVFIVTGWFQTHYIISNQTVGITKNAFTQKLDFQANSGIITKPFFGSVHMFPSSTSFERCEQYTPSIRGSYGVTVDVCFYYNTSTVNWLEEVKSTGSLNANEIMLVWRNSVVGKVASSVKDYTPEQLSDNRLEVEQAILANVLPWYQERGIELVTISLKDWDFTSPDVAKAFDESIIS